jgi:hypothetical protein
MIKAIGWENLGGFKLYCSKCGVKNDAAHSYCSSCGQVLANTNFPGQIPSPVAPPIFYQLPGVPMAPPKNEKFGLSLTAMLIAIYGILSGLIDIGSVVSGDYGYIYWSEVGLLTLIAVISLGFSIPAVVQKTRLSSGALTLSLIGLLIAFASAAYGG